MEIIKKVKLNMTVTPEIKEYILAQSDSMGMSASAYMTMIVNQSKQQQQALSSVDLMKTMIEEIKKLENKK